MARPIDKEKRAWIAKKALELLQNEGPKSVNMTRIAQYCGMKRPTLYWYFEDPEAILKYLTKDLMHEHAMHTLQNVNLQQDPVDLLREYLRVVLDFYRDRTEFVLLMIQFASLHTQDPYDLLRDFRSNMQLFRDAMIERIETEQAAGNLQKFNADYFVRVVRALIEGLTVQLITDDLDPTGVLEFLDQRYFSQFHLPQSK